MLLSVEIILTIFAWACGWKWKALIPAGTTFMIGLFVGIGIAATGGDPVSVAWLGLLDFIVVGVLATMCFLPPTPPKV